MPVTAHGNSIPICEGGGHVTFPTRKTRNVPRSPENSIVSAPRSTNIPTRALLMDRACSSLSTLLCTIIWALSHFLKGRIFFFTIWGRISTTEPRMSSNPTIPKNRVPIRVTVFPTSGCGLIFVIIAAAEMIIRPANSRDRISPRRRFRVRCSSVFICFSIDPIQNSLSPSFF